MKRLESQYSSLILMKQEAMRNQINIVVESMVVLKRGLCTFVQKSVLLEKNGAKAALIVNTDDELLERQTSTEQKLRKSLHMCDIMKTGTQSCTAFIYVARK